MKKTSCYNWCYSIFIRQNSKKFTNITGKFKFYENPRSKLFSVGEGNQNRSTIISKN